MPRFTAFQMVSSGTELSRAFWNMVRSVGFMSGSPPPVRAATSTCLISLAKSLPRALSAAPFLCLIVAHLEWPDIVDPSHLQKRSVEPIVVRQLRMEARHQDRTLPAQHRLILELGQHLHVGAGPFDHRRPDE